ncbi:family A1 protease [Punctularia strigosozonata HHB-11173 SS5]|uniref:Family A1 protease n=1 Tax=Punctularia strigosozonata (strain HHB-11173) TaxID=741275 RepID=R7S1G1_PUNST|nr:family A1 protease [Punctularia strigosozonata HHB-11173 SS5]EIN04215.1 family A1 protease [Punctularia strigosozonata HHB-11173 SS5]
MFRSSALLSLLLLAIGGYTTPVVREPSPVKLPFAVRFNNGTNGVLNVVEADRARINLIKEKGAALAEKHGNTHKRTSYSISVTNTAVTYVASVGVGSPATSYSLLIDTGSSNTWLGADKKYVKTSTSKSTGKSVSVSYGSGSFSGTEYTDTVTLSSDLVITKQSIGVASTASGFSGVDGILGIGPTDLTEGTLGSSSSTKIPTVTDNLYSQGTISTAAVGIYYAPTTVESTTNGELTFGGADSSKYTGSLHYVSLTSTSPASEYWGIDQSIKYGSTSILSSTAGIVDTGTTLVYLATDAFDKYKSATGAKLDSTTGLLRITTAQYNDLSDLVFTIGGKKYTLTPNAQIWPRSLNSYIGGSSSHIYLVVNDIGSSSGSGLDFIDGYTFLERFYTVFDTTNSRFGIATTAKTTATSN